MTADRTESVVETTLGKVRGLVGRRGIHSFRGIPFAAPPVGERRWKPPQPAQPWAGVRDTTHYGPAAPQTSSLGSQLFGADGVSYDEAACLTLNVWTPAPDGGKRPVMVWVHGGAFVLGSGATPWYSGTNLAARGDCVVVTINYRLAALGFLHLADLAGEDYRGSGNAGLLDQVAALRWVRDNAAAFGGDPGNVTVFGESAGAMSISTMLGIPEARSLFRRALPQSGSTNFVYEREQATRVAVEVFGDLGADPTNPAAAAELPVEAVLAAQERAVERHFTEPGLSLPFQPVFDGDTLPTRPLDAVEAGDTAGIDLLTGTTFEEIKLWLVFDPRVSEMDDVALRERVQGLLGDGHDTEALLDGYRRRLTTNATVPELLSAVLTDHVFRIPAIRMASLHSRHHENTYQYLFRWRTPAFGGTLGSCHALELPFVFDNLHMGGTDFLVGERTTAMEALAAGMAESWVRFARHGDPNHDGIPDWPRYDEDRRATMVFDETIELVEDPYGEERVLWSHAEEAVTP